MKFPQLPVGQRFQYRGETLVKVGPMTACTEQGGGTRMIPRSAVVISVTAQPAVASIAGTAPDDARLQAALARFEARWRTALEDLDQTTCGRLEPALVHAHTELRQTLGLDGSSAHSAAGDAPGVGRL